MIEKEPTFMQTMTKAFAGAAFVFALFGMLSMSLLAFVVVQDRYQKAAKPAPAKVTSRLVQ